jgi:hypothetical protein
VAAVTGVAALAALDRALSGHPHKCGRVASRARVRRENSRRGVPSKNEVTGERKKENDGSWSLRYDRSNSDDSLAIALSDTEGGIISLAPSHHCSRSLIQGIQVKFQREQVPGPARRSRRQNFNAIDILITNAIRYQRRI